MKASFGWAVAALLTAVPAQAREDIAIFDSARSVASSHFHLYHENTYAPAGLLNTLESLHAKILLDLGSFSPWAYTTPIEVYLYKDGESYAEHTGMPSWAGAHINVLDRRVYGYPSNDLTRVLAHELGHLFFSQYFLAKSTAPPLWLNEGMATMMEWDYGLEGESDARARRLAYIDMPPLREFFGSSYRGAGSGDGERVSDWYNQAQSVSRFLFRRFPKSQFLAFCEALRDDRSVDQALRSAYGLAIPDTEALDRLWRASLAPE